MNHRRRGRRRKERGQATGGRESGSRGAWAEGGTASSDPPPPALGTCHSPRRGVVSAPGGALHGRRPGCRSSEVQTTCTLTCAARQTRHSVGRRDQSAPTKGRHSAAARAPIGGVRGGALFKPTQGGASPVASPALRLQPLGSRAGPLRPRLPGLPAPRSAPDPLSVDDSTPGSQDSARSAPRVPRAWPPPQFPVLPAPGPAPRALGHTPSHQCPGLLS